MRCRCGNWAWWSKSNLWTSSRRNLQNIRSGWGLYAFHRYPHVGMNFIGCQQFRNINSDWNTEAGNTCREEFQGNAMKQLWISVYILKKLQWWSMVLVWSLNTLEYAGSTSKDFRHFWGHIHTTFWLLLTFQAVSCARMNGWWDVSKQRAPASFLVNGYMFEALMMDCYLSLSLNKEYGHISMKFCLRGDFVVI